MSHHLYYYRAQIYSVYDGDTIRASVDLGFGISQGLDKGIPFRLAGIDTPEMGTEAGRVARDYLRGLFPVGADLVIRTDKDETGKYGRYLATLFSPEETDFSWETSINHHLVLTGHAVPYDGGKR